MPSCDAYKTSRSKAGALRGSGPGGPALLILLITQIEVGPFSHRAYLFEFLEGTLFLPSYTMSSSASAAAGGAGASGGAAAADPGVRPRIGTFGTIARKRKRGDGSRISFQFFFAAMSHLSVMSQTLKRLAKEVTLTKGWEGSETPGVRYVVSEDIKIWKVFVVAPVSADRWPLQAR